MLDIKHCLDLTEGTLDFIMLDQLILANNFHGVFFVIQFTFHFVNFAKSTSIKVFDDFEVAQGYIIYRSFTFDKWWLWLWLLFYNFWLKCILY